MTPEVSILFGTVDRKESVRRLVSAIQKFTPPITYEIIVVDSGKDQSNYPFLATVKNAIHFYDPVCEGFVKAYNKGAKVASGTYIVWMNDDCEVTEGWMVRILDFMKTHPKVGIGGIPFYDFAGTAKQNGPVQQRVLGKYVANFGCVLRSNWEHVGGFAEVFHSYGGETDFCFKIMSVGLHVAPITSVCIKHYRVQDEHRKQVMNKHTHGHSSLLKSRWGGMPLVEGRALL